MSNKKTKNNKNNNLKKEKWCIFKDFTFQTVVERIRFHERFRVDGRQKRIKNHAFPNKSVQMEPKANMHYSGSSIVPCLSTSNRGSKHHNCLEHPRLEQLYLRSDWLS